MQKVLNDLKIRKVLVVVDRDKNMKYEIHNWAIKIFRIPLMLILNMLPARLARAIFLAFSGPNGDTRTVFRSAGTYKALEVMYTFPVRRAKGETNKSDFFWEYFLSNARSIRNRLLLVKREILAAIKKSGQRKEEVRLLSLGSGSARAVFEAVSMLNNEPPVHIKLIDISRKAISFSKELALSFNLDQDRIEWHRDYAHNLEKYCQNFYPDVVEMVGLLDYYPKKLAVDLIAKIYKILSANGWLITCNIRPNLEAPFVTKGINWPLIYRSPQELAEIIIQGGFSPEYLKIVYEPLKIHGVAIVQKLV